MYGVVICNTCQKYRIADLSCLTSECPFCGATSEHRHMHILFEDKDQNVVREALGQLSGFTPEKKDKRRITDADPLSTLIYKYEHCSDTYEKLNVLVSGLSEIYGTFTIKEIEQIDPKNANKMLNTMLELCLISEFKLGQYRA